MYEVVLKDNKWWISNSGKILDELGGFNDPISPKIIVRELNEEIYI